MKTVLHTLMACALALFLGGLAALSIGTPAPENIPLPDRSADPYYSLTQPLRSALESRPALWGGAPGGRALEDGALGDGALGGKVVLVTFFASWCGPCREEMAGLKGIHARHGAKGLEIVAINYFEEFDGYSNPGKLRRFLAALDPPYAVIAGDDGLSQSFGGITRIPTLMVFDRRGGSMYRASNNGPRDAKEEMAHLEKLLVSLL